MFRPNFGNNFGFDPVRFFEFEKFKHELEGITLYYGVGEPQIEYNGTKRVRLNLETPNFLYWHQESFKREAEHMDLCLHLCPFTCNYLNERYNTTKFKSTFFPINAFRYTAPQRSIPVFYTGSKLQKSPVWQMIYSACLKWNGKDLQTACEERIKADNYDGYIEKLKLLAETKICIVHNTLMRDHIPLYTEQKTDPLCVKHLPWHSTTPDIAPQLKSRVFEGAMMGCILLVYYDEFKVIEHYFKENEDFMYFRNEDDLQHTLHLLLENYELYSFLGKNAQKKVFKNYTVEHFVKSIREHITHLPSSQSSSS